MAVGERDQQKKTDARVGDRCVSSREGTQGMKREACIRSFEGPHYEHEEREVTTGDQRRRSGRAYEEASTI